MVSLGLVAGLFVLWPFADAAIRRRRPESEASVWLGVLAVLALIVMTVWEAIVLAH